VLDKFHAYRMQMVKAPPINRQRRSSLAAGTNVEYVFSPSKIQTYVSWPMCFVARSRTTLGLGTRNGRLTNRPLDPKPVTLSDSSEVSVSDFVYWPGAALPQKGLDAVLIVR